MTSKLNPKYSYVKIDRETIDGKRLYSTPDGSKVPSVTTILDKTKPAEAKRALAEWKKRVGEKQAQEITTEAANRGTRMHTYLEHYVLNGVLKEEPSNPFAKPSHAMAKVVINEGLVKVDEFWGMEVPLYFPGVYAGTTDCIGIHQNNESILDFKQSNKPKKEEWIDDYFIQLCAYSEAHNEVHGSKIKKGVILMCVKPDLDKDGLMIGKPKYQEFILEGEKFEKYRSMWWKRVEEYYKILI
jgi:genome maintenance exonuclease 1